VNLTSHFSRFLTSDPGRLHAAAHSHHPWPDVTFAAQQQSWLDAARLQDDKWDHVFGEVIPEARSHVARLLGLPDPATVVFAPNTHELVSRVFSCLPQPARVLTTDAEFHSAARQFARWEEAGRIEVERVAALPFDTLAERLAKAAAVGNHDVVFVSQVLFDSGFLIADLADVVAAVPDERTFVVVDGYHAFMALPVELGRLADRVFYTAGGYKYAMAGEGACFLHCPPGYGPRPVDTGWFAGYGDLVQGPGESVGYTEDGGRFWGATFDPSGLYRFNAVQRWLGEVGVTVADIRAHVLGLQNRFLDLTEGLLPTPDADPRGNFLSMRLPDAAEVQAQLHDLGVITDHRGDRLRIGFGAYHDLPAIDDLAARLLKALRR